MSKLQEKINILKEKLFKKEILKKQNYSLKISTKDKITFLEQLANLLNSWIPITNSLKILIYQTKKKNIKIIIEDILEKVNKWVFFKECVKNYQKIFNQFDISIINMWEVTGQLWEAIETIKEKEEKNKEIKWKIIWALIYPSVIISLAIWMIIVFMVFVIPKITDMYKDAKVNLPSLTQNVISISDFLQKNYIVLICFLLLFIFLVSVFKKHKKTKIYWDKFVLTIPLFWNLIKRKILSLFTSSLWTLLSRWVMINDALLISAGALENDYYEKKIKEITKEIQAWKSLSELMWINEISLWKENFYFPIELSSVVKIWEQTWKMPKLLLKLSQKFNKEIDNIVKNLSTAIEPIVIVFVWIIVWTIIMAIMLPFFNMVNVI